MTIQPGYGWGSLAIGEDQLRERSAEVGKASELRSGLDASECSAGIA